MMDFEEANLPIDIQISKLLDWLISRRHVKKNWSEAIQIIRKKINIAIQDMPEHKDIVKLLSGSYINYFHCLKIIDVLKETEKDSKNIFGWYTSQRMKDWQEIARLYESENVYLAEASHFLVRDVNYEIPSLKKQISKCHHIKEECDKKVENYRNSSTLAQERHSSACKKLGVSKDNIKGDLMGLLKELPERLCNIGCNMKDLEEAVKFHEEYIHFIFSETDEPLLPLLRFVIERGDVTVYEWRHKEAPLSIQRRSLNLFEEKKELNDEEEIDFNIDISSCSTNNDAIELETGSIDWDITSAEDAASIDFEVDHDIVSTECSDIMLESSGFDGGVAKDEEALSLLQAEETRNQLLNEILELQGFLSQRISELKLSESILSMNLFSNSPKSLQYQSVETLERYLSSISKIIRDLTCESMMHLFMISSSPRYVDRLVDSLNRHLRESERALASISSVELKREETLKEEKLLSELLQVLVARSRCIQNEVKLDISRKYNQRPVNLMGVF